MLIDERTYTILPGKLRAYLDRHREAALPVMREHLGEPFAYFTSVDGELHQFVHLWLYTDAQDRERRRATMYADPRWLSYRKQTGELGWVLHQVNRLLQVEPGVGSAWWGAER
jgi:hypothetical protein